MSTVGKLSREEHRRQKDLDAARKAGTAPAEVDEEGRDINPHIPAFMAQAPWYLDSGRPSLRHQRKPEADEPVRADMNKWYARGQRAGPAATKYRAGACENCGAISHKTKDCLERPRKKGAKWTGKNIAADEVIVDIEGLDKDYDAKRDRWNGYDPSQHKKVVEQYEAVEEERRRLREEEIDQQTSTADLSTVKKLANKGKGKAVKKGADGEEGEGEDGDDQKDDDDDDFGSSDDEDEDEDKYADKANMPGQKIDTNKRITVRNLRIREDRAKYLYNLNPESAYYDPKTRSMREAPDASVRPEDAEFAGDNFARGQGDSVAMQKLQLFAWQAESRGNDLHLQANPTVNEIQYRQFQKKRDVLRESTKGSILEKYGGAEHFDSVPKELLTGQTENYVEYSRSGQVIKGAQRVKAKSKYDEDVYENNHTAVWGSWYDIGSAEWGYGCCHSTVPNSYCTGEAGIAAASSAGPSQVKNVAPAASSKRMESSSSGKQDQKKRRRSDSVSSYSSTGSSSASSDYDSEFDSDSDDSRRRRRRSSRSKRHSSSKHTKTSSSTKKQRRKAGKDGDDDPDGLKAAAAINEAGRNRSKFGKGDTDEVSEEQMEAYRRSQANKFEDPMANYRDEE
ncbi:mRNA splicing protein [Tilletia horrida]|uniref:Pre-mRNA-splicing factor SLU7 n=1 Tax=Tilletia horrida TaxID=155126 RepID=A0AAN6GKD5_9BASI|nr:mRNA splicing protein [Tilletia horrida]KAK0551543.1 mRNA splicing protein [Tilletia horrida]